MNDDLMKMLSFLENVGAQSRGTNVTTGTSSNNPQLPENPNPGRTIIENGDVHNPSVGSTSMSGDNVEEKKQPSVNKVLISSELQSALAIMNALSGRSNNLGTPSDTPPMPNTPNSSGTQAENHQTSLDDVLKPPQAQSFVSAFTSVPAAPIIPSSEATGVEHVTLQNPTVGSTPVPEEKNTVNVNVEEKKQITLHDVLKVPGVQSLLATLFGGISSDNQQILMTLNEVLRIPEVQSFLAIIFSGTTLDKQQIQNALMDVLKSPKIQLILAPLLGVPTELNIPNSEGTSTDNKMELDPEEVNKDIEELMGVGKTFIKTKISDALTVLGTLSENEKTTNPKQFGERSEATNNAEEDNPDWEMTDATDCDPELERDTEEHNLDNSYENVDINDVPGRHHAKCHFVLYRITKTGIWIFNGLRWIFWEIPSRTVQELREYIERRNMNPATASSIEEECTSVNISPEQAYRNQRKAAEEEAAKARIKANEERIQQLLNARQAEQEEDIRVRSEIEEGIRQQTSENQAIFEKNLEISRKVMEEKAREFEEENEKKRHENEKRLEMDKIAHEKKRIEKEKATKSKIAASLKKLDDESRTNQKIYKKQQLDHERNMEKQKAELEELKVEHERRLNAEDERFAQNIKEIKEETRRRKEASDRLWEQKRQEADRQFKQILHLLELQRWSSIIENNWTSRLNFLRSANREVERLVNQLVVQLKQFLKNTKPELIDLIQLSTKSLIKQLHSEEEMMKNEASNMDEMYKNTRKSFLKVIKAVVIKVSNQCGAAIQLLEKLTNEKRIDPSTISELDRSFGLLRKASLDIPTLAKLKSQYSEDMKHGEEEEHHDDEQSSSYPEQTVIIEEFD